MVIPFYLFFIELNLLVQLAAIANYFLIAGIWVVSIFLTAMKDFKAITRAFATGMLLGAFGAVYLSLDLRARRFFSRP